MFLDSLAGDGAWLGRYAVSRGGEVMPWSVVEQMVQDTHPYEVFMVRQQMNERAMRGVELDSREGVL
jgi:hypothetical protein